jgi:Spy/CpxP family protein refolding chaperone
MFLMKSIRNTLIASALLAGLSSLAFAQADPSPEAPRPERMAKMHEHMTHRHAQHLAELKSQLKLQADQENAWNTFSQAMQTPNHAATRLNRAALEKMSTPERLDQMQAHKAQRDAEMQKHIEVTKNFYAGLNAEQKKIFDKETTRFMHGMSEHPHRRH